MTHHQKCGRTFEVTLYGRIWVTPEVYDEGKDRYL